MRKVWTDAMLARRQGKNNNNTTSTSLFSLRKKSNQLQDKEHEKLTNQQETMKITSSSISQLHGCDENDSGTSKILEQCILQPGIHHTNMTMITWMGQPLRQDKCPFPLHIQWFRALNDQDDFQIIPHATEEWFTPIADDIGTRLLAKIMLQEKDQQQQEEPSVFRTKMLEYGPIKEDPQVRSHVEHFLEQKSALFMGLLSLQVQRREDEDEVVEEPADNEGVLEKELEPKELKEKWTLLIDDKRVRVTCESLLIPPFEGFYTAQLKVEILRETPNEFVIHFSNETFVHLCAPSNVMRDIIVLTLRAFCSHALFSIPEIHQAITQGISPMLMLRQTSHKDLKTSRAEEQEKPQQQQKVAKYYELPWDTTATTTTTTATTAMTTTTTTANSNNPPVSFHGILGGSSGPSRLVVEAMENEMYIQEDKALSDLLLQVEGLLTHANQSNNNTISGSSTSSSHITTTGNGPLNGRLQISIKDIPELEIVDLISNEATKRWNISSICSSSSNSNNSSNHHHHHRSQTEEEEDFIEQKLQVFQDLVQSKKDTEQDEDMDTLKAYYTQVFCALVTKLKTYKTHAIDAKDQIQLLKEQKEIVEKDLQMLQTAFSIQNDIQFTI